MCAGIRDAIALMKARQLPRPPFRSRRSKAPPPPATVWGIHSEFIDPITPGTPKDAEERAREVLERHEKALAAMAEAAARPEHVPLVDYTPGKYPEATNLVDGRNMSNLLAAQAILQARDGNGDAAVATLSCMFRHAMAIADHPSFLDTMIATAYLYGSLEALETVGGHAALSDENRSRLIDVLVSLTIAEAYRDGLIKDRTGLLEIWADPDPSMNPHIVPLMYYQDIVQLIRLNNRRIEVSSREPWEALAGMPSLRASLALTNEWRYPLTGGALGGLARSHVAVCDTLAGRDVSIVGLACQQHKSRHGAFPGALVDLVPDILPRVPVDPFTGKDLVYRLTPDGFVVYSVGENLADDGGRGRHVGADDIAWPRAKRPPPRPLPRLPSSSKKRF
jgi:hypothetical protein